MILWLTVSAIIILILLPPKYDPAVMFKEWLEREEHDDGRDY